MNRKKSHKGKQQKSRQINQGERKTTAHKTWIGLDDVLPTAIKHTREDTISQDGTMDYLKLADMKSNPTVSSDRSKESAHIQDPRMNKASPQGKSHSYYTLKMDKMKGLKSEESMMIRVRGLFKAILRSAGSTILPPVYSSLPEISGNITLPKKTEMRSIKEYIHYGKMTEKMFTGKILVNHLPTVNILESLEIEKFLSPFAEQKSVTLNYDRFGNNKVVKIGVLMGTLEKESRLDLATRVEELVFKNTKTKVTVAISRERLYSTTTKNSPHDNFVYTTFVKCEVHQELMIGALSILFGKLTAGSDSTRPMIRFIPLEVITGNADNRMKFIINKRNLEASFIIINLRNLRPLTTLVHTSTSSRPQSIQEILLNLEDPDTLRPLFHTVVSHGRYPDMVTLASTKISARTMNECQTNLMSIIQKTFNGLKDEDIFLKTRSSASLVLGMDKLQFSDTYDRYMSDYHMTAISRSLDEELFTDSPLNNPAAAACRNGPPAFTTPKETIDTRFTQQYADPATSRYTKEASRPSHMGNKKAKMDNTSKEEISDDEMSDGDKGSDSGNISVETRASRVRKKSANPMDTQQTAHLSTEQGITARPSEWQQFTPIERAECSTPISALTPYDVEAFQAQQQEIISLKSDLRSIQEEIRTLSTNHQDQAATQSSIVVSVNRLESAQNDVSSNMAAMLVMLTMMNAKMSNNSDSDIQGQSSRDQMAEKVPATLPHKRPPPS